MEFLNTKIIPDYDPESDIGGRAFWRDIIETLIIAVVLFVAINILSARIKVESVSMLPTLTEGDFVFVNKLVYWFGTPERGDVIVFENPQNPRDVPYIKRVIGLPGETVRISDGKVFINELPISEPYLEALTNSGGSWTVPAGMVFVMGDNRGNSSDSRRFGAIAIEKIIGRAEFIYLPVNHWGLLNFPTAVAAEP